MQIPRPQVVLLEASPRSLVDGSVTTVRFAGGGSDSPYRYLSQDWRAGLTSLPAVTAALGFDADGWGAGAIPNVTALRWQPALAADLNTMAGYYWPDAAVTIYTGPDGGTPTAFLTGRIDNASVVDGGLQFTMADLSDDMGRPVLVSRFLGTGGTEGPTDWKDRVKRRAWGRCFNVEGEPIDKANLIYCFADPTKPLQAIDAVRDKGVAASSLTTVAWAGSVAATFAALQAATAPAGGGAIAPSIACVKWWIQPTLITADIKGEIGAGYVETIPAIVERIVADRSGPSFTAGTVTAAVGLRGGVGGVYVDDDGETLATVLDRELGAISLLWKVEPGGTITIAPWAFGSSVASLTSLDVQRNRTWAPHKGRAIGYQRNRREMTTGEIAPVLLFAEITGPKPDVGATPGDNLQVNALLDTDATGYNAAGFSLTRVAGSSGPPTKWVVQTTAASSTGSFIWPFSAVQGGRRVFISVSVLRTAALTTLKFSANEYDAATGSGIGPVGGAIQIAPTTTGVWQTFQIAATLSSNAGSMAVAVEDMTGNAGTVQIAAVKIAYSQPGADVTSAAQIVVTVPARVDYSADYLGTISGSLTTESVRVSRGGVSIKGDNAVSYAITSSGGVTGATVDNTNGSSTKGDITLSGGFTGNTGAIEVVVTVSGVAQPRQIIQFVKTNASPPTTGGTGSKLAATSSFNTCALTTDVVLISSLTVTIASGESLYGTAPLDYEISGTASATRTASLKWQYDAGGGTWTDFVASTYVTGSTASSGKYTTYDGFPEWNDPIAGYVVASQTKSGLSAGDYPVRLVGKLSATGRTATFYGTATIEAKV